MLIVALMIRSFTSFSTFETLYGVVIGFFTGVYIPIGYYPTIIRNIFFYFHCVRLLVYLEIFKRILLLVLF